MSKKRWPLGIKFLKSVDLSRPVPPHLSGKWVHPEYRGLSWLRPEYALRAYAAIELGRIPAFWDIREGDPSKEFCVKAGEYEPPNHQAT